MTDVHVYNQGTVIGFMPMSEAANEWFADNVQAENWQWLGGMLAVDHRYASDLIEGIKEAGLEIEEW